MAGLIGKEIGKYRITERIGRGGMAEVYLGVHTHLDRQVAIKVLHGYLLEGGDFIERFKREAKAVASLRHPNIVQVYDFDIKDEIIFMVMEYIEGANLQQRLVELDKKGERLPIKQIGSIINDIAGALDYAHSQGMLHRDVKPSNILIDRDGKAYLTDFGIARILGDHKLTATGMLVGTPAYMSPEQGRGEELTEESDIYSLGIVAFEMLTGRIPFDAKTPIGIVQKQIFEPVPDISKLVDGVPVTAQGVIDRALAKTPEGRYASAEELVGALKIALQALESAEPITVLPTSAKVDEEKLSAPTVAMEEVSAPGEFEKPTVLMGEGQEPEQQAEAGLPERETKQARVKAEKPKRKIPLWGLITAGVAVLAIAAVVLMQLVGPGPSASEPETPVPGGTVAVKPDQPGSVPETSQGRTVQVTSVADSGPGTLRQALEDAQPYDTITFDPAVFPPDAPATIFVLGEPLPHIRVSHLTLDASDAGIILDGSQVPGDWEAGLQIVDSDSNTIMGLQISHFPGPGLSIAGDAKHNMLGGDRGVGAVPFGQGNLLSQNDVGIVLSVPDATLNTITGNLIGTNAAGAAVLSNRLGIWITEGAHDNIIGPDNIIAYNKECGIEITGAGSSGNTVTHNSMYDNGEIGECIVGVTFFAGQISHGLRLYSGSDNDTEVFTVGETQEQAWRTGNNQPLPAEDGNQERDMYMVFDIEDEYMHNIPPGSQVLLEIEYLDEGNDFFSVEYDAPSGGPYNDGTYKATEDIQKTDSGEFKTAVFNLSDAFFGNRVINADFRLNDYTDGAETIRRVTVTLLP